MIKRFSSARGNIRIARFFEYLRSIVWAGHACTRTNAARVSDSLAPEYAPSVQCIVVLAALSEYHCMSIVIVVPYFVQCNTYIVDLPVSMNAGISPVRQVPLGTAPAGPFSRRGRLRRVRYRWYTSTRPRYSMFSCGAPLNHPTLLTLPALPMGSG